MSEWWTYTLSDFLLFSPRTYRRLFELYNAQTWPLHLLALAIGLGVAGLLWRGRRLRIVEFTLAVAWAWVGVAFLARHYTSINWAAGYLAAAFGVQAVLLGIAAAVPSHHDGPTVEGPRRWCGRLLLVFGVLVQPLVGPLLGRPWSQLELFGMAPDPTVTATLGALALSPLGRMRAVLWPIPLLGCAVSGATLWAMHDPDAIVMPAVAALAVFGVAWRARSR